MCEVGFVYIQWSHRPNENNVSSHTHEPWPQRFPHQSSHRIHHRSHQLRSCLWSRHVPTLHRTRPNLNKVKLTVLTVVIMIAITPLLTVKAWVHQHGSKWCSSMSFVMVCRPTRISQHHTHHNPINCMPLLSMDIMVTTHLLYKVQMACQAGHMFHLTH